MLLDVWLTSVFLFPPLKLFSNFKHEKQRLSTNSMKGNVLISGISVENFLESTIKFSFFFSTSGEFEPPTLQEEYMSIILECIHFDEQN